MNLNLTFPSLLSLEDASLFVLRLVVAIVFEGEWLLPPAGPGRPGQEHRAQPHRDARGSGLRRLWAASGWSPVS